MGTRDTGRRTDGATRKGDGQPSPPSNMKINTILVPQEVAEICYLYEALMWLVFHRFPLRQPSNHYGEDARRDLEWVEFWRQMGCDPIPTDVECLRVGLPPNPKYTAIVGGEGEPPPPEVIRSWQTDALSPTAREIVNQPKVFKQRLTEAIAYKNACVRWEQEFKSFIDLHRNRLFLELREGRLPADGIKAKKGTSQALLKDESANSHADCWTRIPQDFWRSDKINWEQSWAEGRDGCYVLIQVTTTALFASFPPETPRPANVVKVADDFVPIERVEDRKIARGRPPYDWDAFHLEIGIRIHKGDLPKKQEALVNEMQAWCRRAWGREVGRSTISQKLKPYYDRVWQRNRLGK